MQSYEDFQKSSNQTTNKIKIALFDKQNETYFVNQSNQEVHFVVSSHHSFSKRYKLTNYQLTKGKIYPDWPIHQHIL